MDDRKEAIGSFWERASEKFIYPAIKFLERDLEKGARAVVISASPRFLLAGALKYLGNVTIIATETHPGKPSKIISPNCYGREKVKRFNVWLNEEKMTMEEIEIVRVVSDSISDNSLYDLGGQPYKVENGKVVKGRAER